MLVAFLVIGIIFLLGAVLFMFYLSPKVKHENRAENFLNQNMVSEAILEYKKILEKNPGNIDAHYQLAELYIKQKSIDLAVPHLEYLVDSDNFPLEVEKNEIYKKLARIYYARNDYAKAFYTYVLTHKNFPTDRDALYNLSFMILGQERFEDSFRFFSKLVKIDQDSFEIFFGAAISCYQNQRYPEAVEYFSKALEIKDHSDIARLGLIFSFVKKMNYRDALEESQKLFSISKNEDVVFIARRIYFRMSVFLKKTLDGISELKPLIKKVEENGQNDELKLLLYDIGYGCVHGKELQQATEYWAKLAKLDKNYNNITELLALLNRELDVDYSSRTDGFSVDIFDYAEDWLKEMFPDNFLWSICGLKSDYELNIENSLGLLKPSTIIEKNVSDSSRKTNNVSADNLEVFMKLDTENFRLISNRVAQKLGYKVNEILPSYRESDGVDLLAKSLETGDLALIVVRRWRKTKIGEIPLVNFAQHINDQKAKKGLLITTSELTDPAMNSLKTLNKVEVIFPEQLNDLLKGLI